jgi:hypothetical protein
MGVIWETNVWIFVLVTIVLAGGAGYMAGRSAAFTWSSPGLVVAYSAGLACAARFIHMALFGGTLLTIHYWLVDFIVILAVAMFAFRLTRSRQMVRQYPWLYESSGMFSWRSKAPSETVN